MKWTRPALVTAFLAYTAAWSFISLARLYSLNASILDLGVSMQFAWDSVQRLSFMTFLHTFAYKGIVYLVAPVFLTGMYPAVLIFQSAFIGFAVFPLYGISKHFLADERAALLLSASYLIYFPLAGVNWFDFHYQALFPTLFILGYYFYIKGRVYPSLLFMALSSMVHYPYTVFPLLFALLLLAGALLKGKRGDLRIALPLLTFSSFIFILNLVLNGYAASTAGTIGYALGPSPVGTDLYTIILILLPLMFLPLLSWRWLPFLAPYVALLFISYNPFFRFNQLFMYQYPALFVAFVYLGAIEGASVAAGHSGRRKRRTLVIALALFASISAFAVVYQPYGPLNGSSDVNFNLPSMFGGWNRYGELQKMVSLVHPNSTLLVQNNMPEVYPTRTNLTVYDAYDTPYNFLDTSSVDYALADLSSSSFYQYSAPPYNASMYNFIDDLWQTGNYGIVAEASGIILLQRGYLGEVKYFVPMDESFGPAQLNVSQQSFAGDPINVTNFKSQSGRPYILWYGPYTTLYPGLYNVTFWLYTTNSSPSNVLQLQVTAGGGSTVLASRTIEGNELVSNAWTPINVTFYSNGIYGQVEFRGEAALWNGSLLLKGIGLQQTSPGLAVSSDSYTFGWQLGHPATVTLSPSGALEASNLSDTMMWYGPYLSLQPGLYNITFNLATDNSSPLNTALLQVTSDFGSELMYQQRVTGASANGPVTLPVFVNGTQKDVEFRGYVEGWSGELDLLNITVLNVGDTIPNNMSTTYSPYQLYVTTPSFRDGGIISASNTSDAMIWYGPYATLYPGLYNVTFWLYTTNSSPSNVLQLQVTADSGSVYLATSTVNGSSLRPFTWTPITVSFRTGSTYNDVEFRGYVMNWDGELRLGGINETFVAPDG